MADDPDPGDGKAPDADGTVDLVIGESTDEYYKWQQIPARVLGSAAIAGGAILIAFPNHQTSNASLRSRANGRRRRCRQGRTWEPAWLTALATFIGGFLPQAESHHDRLAAAN